MGVIINTNIDQGERHALARGATAEGQVETVQVLGGDRPIYLEHHRLQPGAVMRWKSLPVGRVLFLWRGSIMANGKPMADEGAVVVEHGASCEIRAGDDGCELVEFHRLTEHTERSGGHVHVLSCDEAPSGEIADVGGARAYADSGCPTCELWLHESSFTSSFKAPRHYHTEDEVMVCIRGTMMFGTKELKRGDVLAIDKDALYSFQTAPEGATFINFRSGPSQYIEFDKNGRRPPQEEQTMLRDIIEAPPHVVAAYVD